MGTISLSVQADTIQDTPVQSGLITQLNAALAPYLSDIVQGPVFVANDNPRTGLNFNATSGTDILVLNPGLPAGFTRFMVANMFITNASHTLATVSVGMWSAASAGGTAIIAAYTPGNTSATDGTAHNASIALAAATFGQTTCFASGDSVYVNLVTQEGAATTADVSVEYIPLP